MNINIKLEFLTTQYPEMYMYGCKVGHIYFTYRSTKRRRYSALLQFQQYFSCIFKFK